MNLPLLAAWRRVSTQWRWVGTGLGGAMRTGLDYAAVMPVLQAIAAEDDAWTALDLLDEMRSIEHALIEADAERQSHGAPQ